MADLPLYDVERLKKRTETVKINRQIEKGLLVSPRTGKRLELSLEGISLRTADGTETYPVLGEGEHIVPILLVDTRWAEEYAKSSSQMTREYAQKNRRGSLVNKLKEYLSRDFRSKTAMSMLNQIYLIL